MIRIRRATPADVEGIAAVAQEVWAQEILPEVCLGQIADDACGLWVAEVQDRVVGFVSAFTTVDGTDQRRWELDLVAVRASHRGRGLGARLIRRASRGAVRQDAGVARALIRIANLRSQRAFHRAGFATDHQVHRLFLWRPGSAAIVTPSLEGVSLVPVDTLTYRGLWIEGLEGVGAREQRSVVVAARALAARDKRLNAGALVAGEREYLLAPDVRAQAEMHGEYHWFTRQISAPRRERKQRS